ncbi:sigma-70 family RNA polymerase sigma factor [Paludisphaera sp.]|uniref:RNA polymerase sigma factor n=1 Tax=Paludisphaera sp. TaxID=2017432 RepID=UPI00301D97CB
MTDATTDVDLWRRVREGDRSAFEEVVKRHQSAVAAVAYNVRGDLATSEDVAQEAFWAAWRGRDTLQDPNRLRPWLCGIARNLAANSRRKAAARPGTAALGGDDVPDAGDGPAESALGREEQALIWRSLEELPDLYREPLILYHRQDQSVAEVAATLEISQDAVKQRLSRGRAMLRERLAGLVEEGLRASRPGRSFTVGVMAGLGANLAAKPAAAGVAGAAAPFVASSGLLGGLLGSGAGLAGAWFGAWLPAQAAPTVRERDLMLASGRRMLVAGLVFTATIAGLVYFAAGTRWYLPAWLVAMVGFQAWLLVDVVVLTRKLREAKASRTDADEPNRTAARRGMAKVAANVRGRSHRSRWTLLGLPLLDVQVADPPGFDEDGVMIRPAGPRGSATGWIAVGDDARGALLAVGGRAVGLIAIGDRSLGLVAFGGIAIGGVGLGGLAIGGVAVGGGAFGWVAVGGLAVGAYAAGGAAFGWKLAIGGLAVAREIALGGGSISPRPIPPAAGLQWLRGGPAPVLELAGPIAGALRRLLAGGTLLWCAVGASALGLGASRFAAMYRIARDRGAEPVRTPSSR